jgi:NAD+--asparagine ADP-ribosyltransferase
MTIKPQLQKIFQGILQTESETMKGQAIPDHRRRKGKKVESNIDSATHNQTLNQQRQLNDRNHHLPINTNTEC